MVGTCVEGARVLVLPDEGVAWSRPRVDRSTSRLVDLVLRPITLRRDISGKRTDDRKYLIDVIHATDDHARFPLDGPTTTDLVHEGETAVLHRWSR